MLKFRAKDIYYILNEIGLSVASFFKGQFHGLGEFLVGFENMSFEHDTSFMYGRKTLPGLGSLLEFPRLVDSVIGLGDCLRARMGKKYHVPVHEKIFNFVESIVKWSDEVIMHFYHLFFEIVQMTR